MDRDAGGAAAVRLHLHRGIGWGVYGGATASVFALVLLGVTHNLSGGRFAAAVAIGLAGLALTGFLAYLTYSMIAPGLTASPAGLRGRMPEGGTVDVGWSEVGIDVDEDEPGALRLDVGERSVAVSGRSWIGFRDFVRLLGSTPDAAARLTPAARDEVIRLLQTYG